MTHLIDKDALVAEIERCINRCNDKKRSCPVNTQIEAICDNKINAFKEVISLINTIEVKEVDPKYAFIEKACEWLKENFQFDEA